MAASEIPDRKSTRLNSSHTEIYTLSLHDALPILLSRRSRYSEQPASVANTAASASVTLNLLNGRIGNPRSEEHTSELQSHRDLHSFPTRRSSDLVVAAVEIFRAAGERG